MIEPVAIDPDAYERDTLKSLGMPKQLPMRHRMPQFSHIFSGEGYAAGYYSYIWAEVLDSDAFEAFKERGLFDQATARSFRRNILERGGSDDAMAMWLRFRGREPSVEPLLERRGLIPEKTAGN